MTSTRGFASDNSAGVHPEVLEAIAAANHGHALGYGHDELTRQTEELFAEHFGAHARTFFVFNGSAANVLSVRAACRRWEAVICTDTAHLNVDECGAAEAIAGVKLLSVTSADGKLTPEQVQAGNERIGDEHAVQPRVVSISQCTELGTLYSLQEIRELAAHTHEHDLLLHVDGARIANAAAALGCSLREVTADTGVDLLSFGGTKNGLLGGEAVVILKPELVNGFQYIRKQSLQLASKMRFIAAQQRALLTDQLWLRNARHANAMATRLADAVKDNPGVEITQPVQTNAVFAILPASAIPALQERFAFYVWNQRRNEVRWMCSWDTAPEDVDAFSAAINEVVGRP